LVVAGRARARLCVHPDPKIWLGVPDFLTNSVPARTIASSAPSSERFYFNAKKARYLGGFQQRL